MVQESVDRFEIEAGPGQRIVLYTPLDTGDEVNPVALVAAVADDAARLAAQGWRIMTTAAMPLRHSAVAFGREGSGYASKMALMVVYGALLAG